MASNINPQIIDGAYPVAGQDNDSQGFRDNFTNTKNNFEYAAAEITDLQSKAVLTAPLAGTLTVNNNMNGTVLSNAQLRNMSETTIPIGDISGGVNINYASASYYSLTTSGPVELSFSNFPLGATATLRVQVTITNVAHTLTLPPAVGSGISSTSASYIIGWSSNVITFADTGTYVFEFTTSNGGSTIFIEDLTRTGSILSLDDLSNVEITGTPVGNSILTYNSGSSQWVNSPYPVIPLSEISDVVITGTPVDDSILTYDSGNSQWVDSPYPTITGNLNALSDVVITGTPVDDSILTYDSGNSQWVNSPYPTIPGNLNALSDVVISSPTVGSWLRYTGTQWINVPADNIYPLTVYTVTVADNGSGIQDVFYFNGQALETNTGTKYPIQFLVNHRYRFDVSDISNLTAPLYFSTTPDTIVNPFPPPSSTVTNYSTDVTRVGVPGTPGAYVEILITPTTPSPLYFWANEIALDTSLIGAARPIYVGQINYFLGEDTFAANGNISLETTSTIITSSSDLVGNMAAGYSGQIKILSYGNTSAGNTVITVASAAWGGAGTANLSAVGSSATLQYIGGKWFCVGNNGATFA